MAKTRFTSLECSPPPSLERTLTEAAGGGKDVPLQRLRRWTIRLPECVASELEAIAKIKGLSLNALVMVALDEMLVRQGRQRIGELAPWFPAYLQRVGSGTRKQRPMSTEAEFD
jgi:hypothetical protein